MGNFDNSQSHKSQNGGQNKKRLRRVMPFFGLSLGISVFALSLLVALPFLAMAFSAYNMGPQAIVATLKEPQVWAAVRLSLLMAAAATLTNVVFGVMCAWTLARYDFFGKTFVNALVDLPFALPTAVTGIALATLYAPNGLLGKPLFALGEALFGEPIRVAFTPVGIWLALVVVSFPFIVRAVQPVLADLSPEYEEAAAVMGAGRLRVFFSVILPELMPAILMGAGMTFARACGEYGSVIFIAGNIPMQSEILPLIIVSKLEQYDVAAAACVALFMLLLSLVALLSINLTSWRLSRRLGAKTH